MVAVVVLSVAKMKNVEGSLESPSHLGKRRHRHEKQIAGVPVQHAVQVEGNVIAAMSIWHGHVGLVYARAGGLSHLKMT